MIMKAITLHREAEHRGTFAFVFEPDEDPVALLVTAASEYQLTRCQITAIGGFSRATLGYFDHTRREYLTISLREQVEVLSLRGDVVHDDGKRVIHMNCVLELRDGTTRGGRLLDARVWPTLDVIVTERPACCRDHA
jgi:hypothetical protein